MKREKLISELNNEVCKIRDLRRRTVDQVVNEVWASVIIGGVDKVSSGLTLHLIRQMRDAGVDRARSQIKQIL